jgi:transcriptional regulator with XRE-family HTH domain
VVAAKAGQSMNDGRAPFGQQLASWRRVRGLSQLRLAIAAGVSPRHLSFIESGRSQPSREMIAKLARHLALPLRDQNALMLAAGFAPAFSRSELGSPKLEAVKRAAALVLENNEPFPAVAMDRGRNIVMTNRAGARFREGVDPTLLAPPVNLYRLLLHPRGFAPRIVNFAQYRHYLLARLRQDADQSADATLHELHATLEEESRAGVGPEVATTFPSDDPALTFRVRDGADVLSFIVTLSTFGTPFDLTVAELTIECLFPLDAFTASAMKRRAGDGAAVPLR